MILNKYDANVCISAKNGTGIGELLKAIADIAPGKKTKVKACIPYNLGAIVNELHESQKILSEEYVAEGTLMEILVDAVMYERIKEYVVKE